MIVVCAVAGIIFGAIPGLSGGLGITLLLPLTFALNTNISFCMLLGMYVGGVSGSFVAAVMLGIPGSNSSIATCFDGYPMSQKGETAKALAIGIIGSFIGTFFSVLIAIGLSPVIADLALKLGAWEYFSLCFCAITLVAALSKGNLFKGLIGATVGLILGIVGTDPVTGQIRWTFGMTGLSGGVDIIAVMLGVYALQQIAVDFAKGSQSLPDVGKMNLKGLGLTKDDLRPGVMIKSFLIGLWIGFLPGMGSGLSNMVAYSQAKTSSKYPEKFGTGIPDGIWASEVANNASIGGALIPMIALGIPGDGATALLLSALILHGLQPGPLMMQSSPGVTYMIFMACLVAAIIVLLLELVFKRWFPLLLKVPYHYLYSVIIVMCYVGAFTQTNTMFNVYMMVACAILGIGLMIAEIPMSPLILAFILGPNVENYFRKGMSYGGNSIAPFFTRPVSLIFLLIAFLVMLSPYIKDFRSRRKQAA
ncbi:Tat pathway signal protein [Caproiciproducens sp. NJN-50]|nr:Tat pathway signal protein [Caproiciproducens sp. NJN-50]